MKGISLHVGLNNVNPDCYGGWNGELKACENDAKSLQKLCQKAGMETHLLLTQEATSERVQSEIADCANWLEEGDLFVLSFSCHGGYLEADVTTLVMYDMEIVDYELFRLWKLFKKGVCILLISDSCHSGTVSRTTTPIIPGTIKVAPAEALDAAHKLHRRFFQEIVRQRKEDEPECTVLLLGACQDNQVAYDGYPNGLFTGNILKVLGSNFVGGHKDLHKRLVKMSPADSTPSYYLVGAENIPFENAKPLTLESWISLPPQPPQPVPVPDPSPTHNSSIFWMLLQWLLSQRGPS